MLPFYQAPFVNHFYLQALARCEKTQALSLDDTPYSRTVVLWVFSFLYRERWRQLLTEPFIKRALMFICLEDLVVDCLGYVNVNYVNFRGLARSLWARFWLFTEVKRMNVREVDEINDLREIYARGEWCGCGYESVERLWSVCGWSLQLICDCLSICRSDCAASDDLSG